MSIKYAKKIRQIYRKGQENFWSKAMKPKPRWIPWKVWFWGMSIFIRIEEQE